MLLYFNKSGSASKKKTFKYTFIQSDSHLLLIEMYVPLPSGQTLPDAL